MAEHFDLIVIGGGPSGLMTAITAVTGTPLNAHPLFSALIVEKDQTGEFARAGRLRITPFWACTGEEVIRQLRDETVRLGIRIHEREKVHSLNAGGEKITLKTDKSSYTAKKAAVCCGFFPYGHLLKHLGFVRTVFTPMENEIHYIPQESGYKLILFGGQGGDTLARSRQLKALRPDLQITTVIEGGTACLGADEQWTELLSGSLAVRRTGRTGITVIISKQGKDGKLKPAAERTGRIVLIDYDSFTRHTDATDFLHDPRLTLRNGYIATDMDGNTGVPGVVAAGNIVTPVSGALTALSTGFTAGINLFRQLYLEKHKKEPLLYPWLPLGNAMEHPLYGKTEGASC